MPPKKEKEKPNQGKDNMSQRPSSKPPQPPFIPADDMDFQFSFDAGSLTSLVRNLNKCRINSDASSQGNIEANNNRLGTTNIVNVPAEISSAEKRRRDSMAENSSESMRESSRSTTFENQPPLSGQFGFPLLEGSEDSNNTSSSGSSILPYFGTGNIPSNPIQNQHQNLVSVINQSSSNNRPSSTNQQTLMGNQTSNNRPSSTNNQVNRTNQPVTNNQSSNNDQVIKPDFTKKTPPLPQSKPPVPQTSQNIFGPANTNQPRPSSGIVSSTNTQNYPPISMAPPLNPPQTNVQQMNLPQPSSAQTGTGIPLSVGQKKIVPQMVSKPNQPQQNLTQSNNPFQTNNVSQPQPHQQNPFQSNNLSQSQLHQHNPPQSNIARPNLSQINNHFHSNVPQQNINQSRSSQHNILDPADFIFDTPPSRSNRFVGVPQNNNNNPSLAPQSRTNELVQANNRQNNFLNTQINSNNNNSHNNIFGNHNRQSGAGNMSRGVEPQRTSNRDSMHRNSTHNIFSNNSANNGNFNNSISGPNSQQNNFNNNRNSRPSSPSPGLRPNNSIVNNNRVSVQEEIDMDALNYPTQNMFIEPSQRRNSSLFAREDQAGRPNFFMQPQQQHHDHRRSNVSRSPLQRSVSPLANRNLDRNLSMCDNCQMMDEFVRNQLEEIDEKKLMIDEQIRQNERLMEQLDLQRQELKRRKEELEQMEKKIKLDFEKKQWEFKLEMERQRKHLRAQYDELVQNNMIEKNSNQMDYDNKISQARNHFFDRERQLDQQRDQLKKKQSKAEQLIEENAKLNAKLQEKINLTAQQQQVNIDHHYQLHNREEQLRKKQEDYDKKKRQLDQRWQALVDGEQQQTNRMEELQEMQEQYEHKMLLQDGRQSLLDQRTAQVLQNQLHLAQMQDNHRIDVINFERQNNEYLLDLHRQRDQIELEKRSIESDRHEIEGRQISLRQKIQQNENISAALKLREDNLLTEQRKNARLKQRLEIEQKNIEHQNLLIRAQRDSIEQTLKGLNIAKAANVAEYEKMRKQLLEKTMSDVQKRENDVANLEQQLNQRQYFLHDGEKALQYDQDVFWADHQKLIELKHELQREDQRLKEKDKSLCQKEDQLNKDKRDHQQHVERQKEHEHTEKMERQKLIKQLQATIVNQQERINQLEKQLSSHVHVNEQKLESENENQQYVKQEAPQTQNRRKSKSRSKLSKSDIRVNQSQSQQQHQRQSISMPISNNFLTSNNSQQIQQVPPSRTSELQQRKPLTKQEYYARFTKNETQFESEKMEIEKPYTISQDSENVDQENESDHKYQDDDLEYSEDENFTKSQDDNFQDAYRQLDRNQPHQISNQPQKMQTQQPVQKQQQKKKVLKSTSDHERNQFFAFYKQFQKYYQNHQNPLQQFFKSDELNVLMSMIKYNAWSVIEYRIKTSLQMDRNKMRNLKRKYLLKIPTIKNTLNN